jgi:hypothetical protein
MPLDNQEIEVILTQEDDLDIESIFQNANRRAVEQEEIIIQDPRKLVQAFMTYRNQDYPGFEPGDLVTWKPGFRNRRVPDYGQPCVVFQKFKKHKKSTVMVNKIQAIEDRVDMECAAFDDDGDLYVFLCDSQRMTFWEDKNP